MQNLCVNTLQVDQILRDATGKFYKVVEKPTATAVRLERVAHQGEPFINVLVRPYHTPCVSQNVMDAVDILEDVRYIN